MDHLLTFLKYPYQDIFKWKVSLTRAFLRTAFLRKNLFRHIFSPRVSLGGIFKKHLWFSGFLLSSLLLNSVLAPVVFAEQPYHLGEFMLEINVIDQGRGEQVLDHTKITHRQSDGNFHNRTVISTSAQLEYTSEKNLRFVFNKPIILHLKNLNQEGTTYQRLLSHVEVQLAPKLISNFEMAYLNRTGDLIASMDVLDYSLDFLEEAKELHRLRPKDYSDGNFYRIPVITKALKDIRLSFAPLESLLLPNPILSRTSIEFQSVEIAQIHAQNLQLTHREFRLMNLAETMASLASHSKDAQDLVHFRTQALHFRNEMHSNLFAMRNEPHPRLDQPGAMILDFPSPVKSCRSFLGVRNSKNTAEILPFTPW